MTIDSRAGREELEKLAAILHVSVEELLERPWVVWSEEHGGWWRPGEGGYTHSLKEAGRFSMERALEIEKRANQYLPSGGVNEVAMADPWARPRPRR